MPTISIILDNLESIQSLLAVPNTLSEPKKRWRSAFVSIYYYRAFLSLFKTSLSKKKNTKISPSHSFIILDLNQDNRLKTDQASLTKIDQKTLTELVKEKNIEKLQIIGGIDRLASDLKTNVESGIQGNIEDIAHRHEAFGTNTYNRPPTKSFFHSVVEAFKDFTILILLGCAVLSLVFGIKENGIKEGWYDGGSIFVAVFLVIAVSTVCNFRQSRQFDKLSKVINNIQIEVVRAGRRQQISIFEIVVGDVICLKIGDQVPADGLFLDGHSLQVDQSSITGESDHVEVNCSHPFLFSGTTVVDGYVRMLVTSVGMNTIWGEMMSSISRDANEQAPLQVWLNRLTSSIGKVGLAVTFLLVRYFTENGNKEFNGSSTKVNCILNAVVGTVAAAVAIVVYTIPEGLPLAVTLILAYSIKRMMANQAMVRKLPAYETMGFATVICTDKTGTLTMDKMKVTKFWPGKEFFVPATSSSNAPYFLKLLQEGVSLNTTGSVYKPASGSEIEFSGSPTEQAILSWAVLELSMEMEQLTQSCKILSVEAFNSQKKRSGVLMRRNADNTIHVHWKGAAEMILKMCSSYYDASGIMEDLDDGEKMKFERIIQGMAASSLRCIAFAHKQVLEEDQEHDYQQKKIEEDGLTLLGLVGIKNPCRLGVKKAVEDCQNAGVNIKMITGDNVFTAKAIATECGILRFDQDVSGVVVEGIEFRNYTPEERMERVGKICVMARSSPFDKLQMVKCLRQKGYVVAVIGDGTNDALALKEANVGLSMGIQGTEVAKEMLDIVILDNNFASVARVLRWGRCVYNNIQKFIQFQLTVYVAALVINFVVTVSVGKVPLTTVQLLWVNLIIDTLSALALATEKPTEELMTKPPVCRTEPLITNIMWRNLLAQALYQIIILLVLQFKGESIFSVTEKVKNTLIFNTFVLCQVFNEFNARNLEKKNVFEGIHRNKLFLGIIAITIILQVVMVEFLKKFADTERLNWGQWGVCIGIGIASWPIDCIVKWIPVPHKPLLSYLRMK
ncbi:putative calcium-transporting ATPase 13, plasma membrane-type [Quercus lobata]|uniref:Calcium-transporting ATPase n=1 Tax=Quercus lobata TaxID=97700 RepID=A0A7N2LU15_QUELO|nr:putative calcium-transporting ATPase 13, plasma membrane-type [Quercus lobata]